MHARLKRGDEVPGFFANVYPRGDPRTAVVLEDARVATSERTNVVRGSWRPWQSCAPTGGRGMHGRSVHRPRSGRGRSLGLPSRAATALFALGRTAGWIAHVMEQRASEQPLRPRARFVPCRSESCSVLADEEACLAVFAKWRWPNGFICPRCRGREGRRRPLLAAR